MSENVFAYAAPLWRRFRDPAHAGSWPEGAAVRAGEAGSRAAKFVLRVQVKGAQARFKAYGCPTAIAVGEWLCEQIERDGIESMRDISAAKIRAALEIPEDKSHCAMLGEDVIKALLKS